MNLEQARKIMVENQLKARGIANERVLNVFYKVPRDVFVPDGLVDEAYGDYPLPIGEGQTISQPYMVALMTETLALTGTERVLEIGTGSGYQAAILAEISFKVYTIERLALIAATARKMLKELGYANIYFKIGDGTQGWDEFAPFDRIIVTAGAHNIPSALLKQLANRGRLVIPLGGSFSQVLTLVEKDENGKIRTNEITPCIFVPLVGA